MPSSRAVFEEITGLLDYLLTSEIALFINPVALDPGRVTWLAPSGETFQFRRGGSAATTMSDYLTWAESGQYSAILFDGALLQLSYDLENSVISGHRLAYIPSPVVLDDELLQTEPLGDVIRLNETVRMQDVELRSPIRFDFDPRAAREGHPAVHLTINVSECRIACSSPIRIGNFLRFVLSNFYSPIWRAHPYLQDLPMHGWGTTTVTDDEVASMHIHWRNTSNQALLQSH